MFTNAHKNQRMAPPCAFLDHTEREGDIFFSHTTTSVVTWICYNNPSNDTTQVYQRQQNSNKHSTEDLATVFWNQNDTLLMAFIKLGVLITLEGYCERLSKLMCVIQNQQYRMLMSRTVLIDDNAFPSLVFSDSRRVRFNSSVELAEIWDSIFCGQGPKNIFFFSTRST